MATIRKLQVSFEGHTIHTIAGGVSDGPCLLFIHGLGMSSRYFKPLAEIVAEKFSVQAVDLPGFGESWKPKEVYNLRQQAEFLARFIRHEHLENVILVGHSMGCQIIVELLSIAPNLTDRVILIAPTVNSKEKRVYLQLVRLIQDGTRELMRLKLILLKDYIRCGAKRYFTTLRYTFDQDLNWLLKECAAQVMVVAGNRDPIAPLSWAREVEALLPRSVLVEVNSAHAPHYSHTARIAELCIAVAQAV